ncbi:uncharacterized protein [Dysidea avara]|uniref:uncharacterized protein n=1 Tax=Dysidea avara TaxID=196820 RepID=UPI0033349323
MMELSSWNHIWTNPFAKIPSLLSQITSSSSRPLSVIDEQYALITSPHDVLDFDHNKGVALCIGIDKQYHKEYQSKSLGVTVANDAKDMGEAFINKFGIHRERIKVYASLAQPDQCSKAGIRSSFMQTAGEAEEDSIFIFYFAGHGYLVRKQCVLAPADFAGVEDLNTGVSGDDLVEWLHAAGCKAKHVLIILDCCFAGDLGTSLTSPGNILKVTPGVFVMCGCAAREKCMSIHALGHSIFTYFFLRYLERQNCKGQFPITKAMEEIAELCMSFSSLLVKYNHETGDLLSGTMTPTLDRLDFKVVNLNNDGTDFSRLGLLISLYDKSPKSSPHLKVDEWLNSQKVRNSLQLLKVKASFNKQLQNGILCAMLYSVASIQVANDKTHVNERNLFVTLAISVVGAIGFAYPEVNISILQLIDGLQHYRDPVFKAGLNIQFLNNLLSDMCEIAKEPNLAIRKSNPYVTLDDVRNWDGVDGLVQNGATNKKSFQLCKAPIWEPLQ